jgi:hypothetical protein
MIILHHSGRLGNTLLQDIGASILSKHYDLKVVNYWDKYGELNPKFNYSGRLIDANIVLISDLNYSDIINKINSIKIDYYNNFGLRFSNSFQCKEFILQNINEIKNHFDYDYKIRKDEVFIHVRLGDVKNKNPGFEYYNYCLQNISFKQGFISSDSPDHHIVKELCKKYGLILFENDDPRQTLLFARQFDHLILSGGTFSWWIGVLSKAKNIFYPKNYLDWHGDIFVFEDWHGV